MSTDTFEHNPGDHEDPLAGPTWTVGVIGVALFAVTVLGVAALFFDVRTREAQVKVIDRPTIALDELRAEQLERLQGPARRELRPENEGAESLVIPIDDAIRIYAREAPVATP